MIKLVNSENMYLTVTDETWMSESDSEPVEGYELQEEYSMKYEQITV